MTSVKDGILSVKEKIGFGLGDGASNFYWKITEFYILFFYTDVFGITPLQAGAMFGVARLWDAINDPVMGMLADRTRTKWGRYRPYLLWGCIPMSLIGVLTFYTPGFKSDGNMLAWAYVTYFLFWMLYTFINIPYSSVMAVMTPNAQERTVLSSYRFIVAFIIATIVSTCSPYLVTWFGGENDPKNIATDLGFVEEVTESDMEKVLADVSTKFAAVEKYSKSEVQAAMEKLNSAKKEHGFSEADDNELKLIINAGFEKLLKDARSKDEKALTALKNYKDSVGLKATPDYVKKVLDVRTFVFHFKIWNEAAEALAELQAKKALVSAALAPPAVETITDSTADSTVTTVPDPLNLETAKKLLTDSKMAVARVYKPQALAHARKGWPLLMTLYGVFAIIFFLICFATTRERVEPSVKQDSDPVKDWKSILTNGPWFLMFFLGIIVITGFVFRGATGYYYLVYYLKKAEHVGWFYLSGTLASVVGVFGMPFFTKVFGKKYLYMLCMGGGGALTFIYYIIPPEAFWAVITMNCVIGLIMGPTAALMFAMFADVADYGEWKTGRRVTGLVMAAAMLSLKAGGALGSLLNGAILESFGYIGGALEQTPKAMQGILLLMSVIPGLLCIGGAAVVFFYKLDKKMMTKIEIDLKERKEKEGAGSEIPATA